jgi:hypothetical protein
MSYVHCSACNRAYNLAIQPVCPFCPVPATVVDPAEDIVAAADQLARALARATPAQRAAAAARMDRLAIQLAPAPQLPPPPPARLAPHPAAALALAFASALERRLARHAAGLVRRVRALAA